MSTVEDSYTPEQAAELLGITRQTAYLWRKDNYGPPFFKNNNRVHYPKELFHKWYDAHDNWEYIYEETA